MADKSEYLKSYEYSQNLQDTYNTAADFMQVQKWFPELYLYTFHDRTTSLEKEFHHLPRSSKEDFMIHTIENRNKKNQALLLIFREIDNEKTKIDGFIINKDGKDYVRIVEKAGSIAGLISTALVLSEQLSGKPILVLGSLLTKKIIIPLIAAIIVIGAFLLADTTEPTILVDVELIQHPPTTYHGSILKLNFLASDTSGIAEEECYFSNGNIYSDLTRIAIGKHNITCKATDNSINRNESFEQVIITVQEPDKSHWPSCVENYIQISDDAEIRTRIASLHNLADHEFNQLREDLKVLSDNTYNNRDFQTSLEISSLILEMVDPYDRESLSQLGIAFRALDIDEKSLTCSETVHEIPEIRNTIYGIMALAEDKLLLERYLESIKIATELISKYGIDPNIENIHYGNTLIIRGNAYYNLGDLVNAEEDFHSSIKVIGKKSDSLFGLGNVEFRKGEDYEKTAEYYKEALEYESKNCDIIEPYFRTLIFTDDKKIKIEYERLVKDNIQCEKTLDEHLPELRDKL